MTLKSQNQSRSQRRRGTKTKKTPPAANPQATQVAPNFNPKGMNDKPDRPVGVDIGASAGDIIDAGVRWVLSPGVIMTVGYMGAGVCLSVGIYAYSLLLVPALCRALPGVFGLAAGYFLAIVLGLFMQLLEIFPRVDEYFPELAEEIVVKLKLTPVPQMKADANSQSLLPKANDWAKKGAERLFGAMEGASYLAYGLETIGGLNVFPLLVDGSFSQMSAIGLVVVVGGFEACLKFVSWMKLFRLTGHQSRVFREHKKTLTTKAEADLLANK